MPNENRDDYHVELLKSVRNLKKIIDELVDKNHERMGIYTTGQLPATRSIKNISFKKII